MASNESNIDEYDFTMEIDIPPECLPVNPNEVSNTVSSLTESNSSSNSETDSHNGQWQWVLWNFSRWW